MNDIPLIMESLQHSAFILEQFSEAVPDDDLHRRRGDGFWTIAEHIDHLGRVQPMLCARIDRFLNEDAPEFVPFIPSEEDGDAAPPIMSLPEAITAFSAGRNDQIALLEKATPEDWQKVGAHPEYTRYTLYILSRHILMHDHWHMYRMEELWLTRDKYLTVLEG